MEKLPPPRGSEPRQQRGTAAPIVSERQEIDDDPDPPATEESKTEAITSLATVRAAEEEVDKQGRAMVLASVVTSTSVAAAIICNETQLFPFLAKNIDDDSSITVALILGMVLPVGAALTARGYLLKCGRQIAASERLDGDATMRVSAEIESRRRSGDADGGLPISADNRHTQRARDGRQVQRVGQLKNSAEAEIKCAELKRKIQSVRIATEAHVRREDDIGKLTLEAMDKNDVTTRNLRRVEQRVTAALDTLRSLGVVAQGTANDQLSQANIGVLRASIGAAEAKRDACAKATASLDLEHGLSYQDMLAAAQTLARAELKELERVLQECVEAAAAASKQRQKALSDWSLKAQQVREGRAKRDASLRANRQNRHAHTTLRFNAEQKMIAALKATAAFKAQVDRACARLEGQKGAASADRVAVEACVRAFCGSKTTQSALDRRRTACEKLMTDMEALDERARTAQKGKCELDLLRAQKEAEVKAAQAEKAAAGRDYGRAVAMSAQNEGQRKAERRRQMRVEERRYREEGKQAPATAATSPSLGSSDGHTSTEGGARQEDRGVCTSRKIAVNAGEHTDSVLLGAPLESRQYNVSSESPPVAESIHCSAGALALPSTPARHDASTSAGLLAAGERFQHGVLRGSAGANASPPAAAVVAKAFLLPSVIPVAPMAAIASPPTTEVSALPDMVVSEGGRVASAWTIGVGHQNEVVSEDGGHGGEGSGDASRRASRSTLRSAPGVAPVSPPAALVASAEQSPPHFDPGVVPPRCAGGGSVARGQISPFCGLADTPSSPPSDRQHVPGLHIGPATGFAFGSTQSASVNTVPSESIRRGPNSWARPVQGAPFQSAQVSSAFARPAQGASIHSPPGFSGLHQASWSKAAERMLAHADIQQPDPALPARSPRNLSADPGREPFVSNPPRQPPICFPAPGVSLGIAHSPMYRHPLQAPYHQRPQQQELSEVAAATREGRDVGIMNSNGSASGVCGDDGNGGASCTNGYRPFSTASILPSPAASGYPFSAEVVPPGRASEETLDANVRETEGCASDFGRADAVGVSSSVTEVGKVPVTHPSKMLNDAGRSGGSVTSGELDVVRAESFLIRGIRSDGGGDDGSGVLSPRSSTAASVWLEPRANSNAHDHRSRGHHNDSHARRDPASEWLLWPAESRLSRGANQDELPGNAVIGDAHTATLMPGDTRGESTGTAAVDSMSVRVTTVEDTIAPGDERRRRHISCASVEAENVDAVRVFAARAVKAKVVDASSADIEGVDAAAGTAQCQVMRAEERKETVKKRDRQLEAFLENTGCMRLLAKFSKDEMDPESIGFMRDSDFEKFGVTKAEMSRMRAEISKLVVGNRGTAGTGGGQNNVAADSESDDQEETGGPQCTVCWDAKPQIQFLPCGHLVVCEGCLRILKKKLCPTCRQKIEGTVKVFRS